MPEVGGPTRAPRLCRRARFGSRIARSASVQSAGRKRRLLVRWHGLGPIAEPSMLCAELANILTLASAGSHRTVNGAQSMFAKSGKHTLGWQTYSGDGGKAFGTDVRCLRRRAEQ